MADITSTPMVNAIVATAKDLPDLVNKLAAADPKMAQQITGQSLIASKSPPVVALAAVVTWASAKFGLGWDSDFCTFVAFGVVFVASYVMRYFSRNPISGLFTRTKTAPTGPS